MKRFSMEWWIIAGLVVLSSGFLWFLMSNLADEEVMVVTSPEEMAWYMVFLVFSKYVYMCVMMWIWKVCKFDDLKLRLPDVELEEVVCK